MQLRQRPGGESRGSTDFVTCRTFRVICVFPCRLWMNLVFVVPKRRSQHDPNHAFAGGLVFLMHSYLASRASKYVLWNSGPPSITMIWGSRAFRRTHSRRIIMQER